jgi:L-histidine N-alpha-methyltransferase
MISSKSMVNPAVAEAVAQGLGSIPKRLPSWLLYDETGDMLFQQIMRMPEYYPTRCEYDILKKYKDELLTYFKEGGGRFHLIELGAGDGLKTEVLLEHFLKGDPDFTYLPIDISANALQQLTGRLKSRWPDLVVHPVNKAYHQALINSLRDYEEKKAILFMGANIGNFSIPEASELLKKIVRHLSANDFVLIGFDLKKDPRVIQEAYDDPHGLTREFNLNLLSRLNRELAADFAPELFSHYPYYDLETGAAKSFLVSLKKQSVRLEALGRTVHFDLWESIQTEVSQKYDVGMIEKLLAISGMKVVKFFFDEDSYFCDALVKSL